MSFQKQSHITDLQNSCSKTLCRTLFLKTCCLGKCTGISFGDSTLFVNPDFINGEPATSTLAAPLPMFEPSGSVDRLAFPWNTPSVGRFSGHIGLVSVSTTWAALSLSTNDVQVDNINLKHINSEQILQFNIPTSGTLAIY